MNISEVRWRKGTRAKVTAEVAFTEFERIKAEHGGELTAGMVVEASKPKSSPLHAAFEWNNKAAAEKWREQQARVMISSIEVVYEGNPRDSVKQYEIAIKRESNEAGTTKSRRVYQSLDDLLSDPQERQRLVNRCIQDLVRIRNRYIAIQELAVLFAPLDEFVKHKLDAGS